VFLQVLTSIFSQPQIPQRLLCAMAHFYRCAIRARNNSGVLTEAWSAHQQTCTRVLTERMEDIKMKGTHWNLCLITASESLLSNRQNISVSVRNMLKIKSNHTTSVVLIVPISSSLSKGPQGTVVASGEKYSRSPVTL